MIAAPARITPWSQESPEILVSGTLTIGAELETAGGVCLRLLERCSRGDSCLVLVPSCPLELCRHSLEDQMV